MEKESDDMSEKKDENLIEDEPSRESIVELGRISENTQKNIEGDGKKVSSIQTIFSIWNTMIGSTTVSIPYNVYLAGIVPTIFIGLLYGFICYFTCSIYVKLSGNDEEFANIVFSYFHYAFGKKSGKIGKTIQLLFNLMINVGATFVYFLIINQNFYPCLCLFLKIFGCDLNSQDIAPHFNQFSIFYCSLLVCIVVFPLTILKEMGCLVKFNSLGIYFVSGLLLFVIYSGIASLTNTNFHFEYKENVDGSTDRYLYLFGPDITKIMGTLSLGLFCHSVILPVLKNNRKQENNQRDLFIGYTCVTFTYIIIGILGYIGFSGKDYKPEFEDNWFRFSAADNYLFLALRLLNVVQLTSIFPILFFVVRKQLFSIFFTSDAVSNKKYRIIFSVTLLILCILILYFFYNSLGTFISFLGASTALILVYTVPPLTNMIYYYIRHQTKGEVKQIVDQRNSELSEEEEKKPILPQELGDPVPLKSMKAFFFYFSMMAIIVLGIMTFVLQFVKVNFFNITIQGNNN